MIKLLKFWNCYTEYLVKIMAREKGWTNQKAENYVDELFKVELAEGEHLHLLKLVKFMNLAIGDPNRKTFPANGIDREAFEYANKELNKPEQPPEQIS